MKKERKTLKQLIVNWLGIDTKLEILEQKLDSLERGTTEQLSDFEYNLDEKADAYQVDNLESEIQECVADWKVEEMIESHIEDLEFPTHEDIKEIAIEETHEMVLEMVKNTVSEIEQRNFDYDLVVSQVVSIIVEKLNN